MIRYHVFHMTAFVVVKAIHRCTIDIRSVVCDYIFALQNFNGALW